VNWVLGLDGGGSKTAHAYANREGEVVGPFYAPGINPFDQPEWESGLSSLLGAHPAPGLLSHATLGLPGYGESPTVSARQLELSSELLPCPLSVMNDVEAAFVGAFAGGPGALLLAGTGSMAWAGNGQRQVRSGGWGDGFGDEGSAYWIGRQALSLASQGLDGRWPDAEFAEGLLTPLFGKVPEQAQLLDWYFGLTHTRSGVAALARAVDALAEAQQTTALRLLGEAADQLARHVQAARKLLGEPELPWSYAGSVLSSRTILSRLVSTLGGAPLTPRLPPLGGALFHAARQAGFNADHHWQMSLTTALLRPALTPTR
jgi:glucosamine kinase